MKSKKRSKKHIVKSNKNYGNTIMDRGQVVHYFCIMNGLINVDYDFNKLFTELSKNIDTSNEIEMILFLIDELESRIRGVVSKFSLYEMIYFSRRIAPKNIFKCEKNEIFLYRNIMALAFQKYSEKDSLYADVNDTLVPICMKNIDITELIKATKEKRRFLQLPYLLQQEIKYIAEIFSTCYLVEFYSFYHVYLVKQYRTLCKGAEMHIGGKYGVYCCSDRELLRQLVIYDNRSKNTNIISHIGGYSNLRFSNEEENNYMKFKMLQFQENLEQIDFKLLSYKNDDIEFLSNEVITNYFPIVINLENYYEYIKNFDVEFLGYYGFTIESFLIFLIIICQTNIANMVCNIEFQLQMFQRGYAMFNYNELKDDFMEKYEEFACDYNFEVSENKSEVFDKIFDYLSCSEEFEKNINLKSVGPYKIFLKFNNNIGIIDYTNWGRILEQIMIPICKDNDKKGNIFENIVIKRVEELFGQENLWITQRHVKVGNEKREIDVSFVYENILILLECKAINVSRSTYIGDKKAVDFRQMKNTKAIEQANKTLNFIRENWNGLNIKKPDNIEGIVSLIVTPAAEYIWKLDDNLMINNSLPRILSINELQEIKNISFKDDVSKTKFFREL